MSTSDPIFTIITPVDNGAPYIRETIESVLASSSRHNCEYIVIDDGSSDNTLEILEYFNNQLQVVTQRNAGESAAVNLGIDLSKGKFLLIVSADDPLFTSEIFENVAELFESHDDLVAIYPDWRIIDSKNRILEVRKIPEFTYQDFLGRNLVLPGPGTIFKKEAAVQIGGRDTKWKFVGDYDFWLRLSDLGKIKHRNHVLAQWRTHTRSTSVSQRGKAMAKERIEVIEEYFQRTKIDHSKRIKRMALGNAYSLAARLIYFDKEVPGKKLLWKAVFKRCWWPERLTLLQFIFIVTYPLSRVAFIYVQKFLK